MNIVAESGASAGLTADPAPGAAAGHRPRTVLPLFFASGFAALVYQVLWVRQVGLLVGSTAQAAALTIAIFFAGLAVGGWWWGGRAARTPRPLRTFGLVEIGVAVTALGHFALVGLYEALYPALYAVVASSPVLDLLAKALVAAVILGPPSFLMGGTLPLMGQHVVRSADRLGRVGGLLYGVNTAGSAAGALAAGFVLPLALGLAGAYLLAVAIDLLVGVVCVFHGRRLLGSTAPPGRTATTPPAATAPAVAALGLPVAVVWTVAAVSGFTTLGIEVVWTRLFSQVLQNSAATYALVLASFLVALALGGFLASVLARLRWSPEVVLGSLLALAGVAAAASPWLFDRATDGLSYLGGDLAWAAYLVAVAAVAAVVILVPGTALGAVLPYLLRVIEVHARTPGEALGRLLAVNTAGAIAGSLAAGFVLLPRLGAGQSLLVLAAAYPALLAVVALVRLGVRRAAVGVTAAVAVVALLITDAGGLNHAPVDRRRGEHLVEAREGAQANVAVVGRGRDRLLRVDSTYTLGGSRGRHTEQNQTVIPLLLSDDPRSVFYLGMGTGITAGAAMPFPVDRVVVCELIADVVHLAEDHFGRWTNGLFDDPRVEIAAEDGRSCLRRDPERFDLIISDLFTPWQAGTGNLYTREHYATAAERLERGGLFVQWVPLYQVGERELAIIGRTMGEAFEQVTLWRGDLLPSRSIVAFVGQADAVPLDPSVPARQARRSPRGADEPADALTALALHHYAGNVSASGIFADAPINTDHRPLIEHLAPRTHRSVRAGSASFVVGEERERLFSALRAALPIEADPYLSELSPAERAMVHAGDVYSRSRLRRDQGKEGEADALLAEHLRLTPLPREAPRSPARVLLGG